MYEVTYLLLSNLLRWKRISSDNVWMGVFSGSVWQLQQDGDYLHYDVFEKEAEPPKSATHLNTREAVNVEATSNATRFDAALSDYFQLGVNLDDLYKSWTARDAQFAALSSSFSGIRQLRQDPVENLFSFICSSNNNIARFVWA